MTTPSQVYYANPCNSALCGRFLFQTCSEVHTLPAGVKQVKAPSPPPGPPPSPPPWPVAPAPTSTLA